jgi:multiple sugar transport system permease protein
MQVAQESSGVEERRAPEGARRLRRIGQSSGDLLFLLPALVLLSLAVVLPSMSAMVHAFTDWQPGYESPWVGFGNFTELFGSIQFRQILANHAVLLLGVPIWVLLPLAVSFLLYQRVPYAGVFRAIFFFPALASPALIGILFAFVLAPAGPLNELLRTIGLGGLAGDWLAQEHLVKPVIIAVLAWATMGMGVVIFSAALSAVPPELFESAELDGASWWQRLWHIVLPSIRHVVELWTVILIVSVFVGIFPWIYTLTRGGPGYSSTTLDWDIYQNALTYGYFGLAAAEAMVLLVIVAVIAGLGVVLSRKAART